MSWRYVPTRQTVHGEEVWEIREFYTNIPTLDGGTRDSWTTDAMRPRGDTRNDLMRDIQRMLEVFLKGGREEFLDLDANPPRLRHVEDWVDADED